jgi:hypothetical protein
MAMDFEFDDDADDEYFAEYLEDVELTGKEPKFVKLSSLATPPANLATLKVDEIVKMYVEERNQLATDRKGYKVREDRIKTHLALLSSILKDKGETLGVDSFATPFGTAFKKIKDQFRVQNWEDLTAYVRTTGFFQILQKRVSPNAVKEIKEVDGSYPPGVEHVEITEFSVRVPTARKSRTVGSSH